MSSKLQEKIMKLERNTEKVESIITKNLKKKADKKAHDSGMSMATYIRFLIAMDVAK